MSPYPPEECDTPESQRDFYADLARAIDEDEARRPTAADEADERGRR